MSCVEALSQRGSLHINLDAMLHAPALLLTKELFRMRPEYCRLPKNTAPASCPAVLSVKVHVSTRVLFALQTMTTRR